MNNNSGPAPCGICGGVVSEVRVKGERSIGDVTAPIEIKRLCRNPRCDSNTGSASIADEV